MAPENPHQLPLPEGGARPIEPAKNLHQTVNINQPATAPVTIGQGVVTDIGNSNITERAEQIRYATDEAMIWQEAPSLALLVPRAIKYAIFLAVIFVLCNVARNVVGGNPMARTALAQQGIQASASAPAHRAHKAKRHAANPDDDATAATPSDDSSTVPGDAPDGDSPRGLSLNRIFFWIKSSFTALYLLLFLNYWFQLKATKYCASSQRLIVEEGAWHAVNRPYELHQIGDAVIEKPALLRMFKVANLIVTNPRIELKGLRNAEYVRDILRQSGQLEAQRVDKIRYR